ncbi:LytTR family DNA-binding domain-containing protein [Deltaproteobacteria bacterium TL4]
MENPVPIDEVRYLRRILEGLDMVFHTNSSFDLEDRGQEEDPASIDSAVLMRQMMALNKIELLLDRILFICAESPYCRVSFESQNNFELDLRVPIHMVVEHFKEDELLRVHRSYLVNPKRVLCVDRKNPRDFEMWMKSGPRSTIQVPVGRSYVSKLRNTNPRWFKT